MEKILEALEKAGIVGKRFAQEWVAIIESLQIDYGVSEEEIKHLILEIVRPSDVEETIQWVIDTFNQYLELRELADEQEDRSQPKQRSFEQRQFCLLSPLLLRHIAAVGNDGYGSGFL